MYATKRKPTIGQLCTEAERLGITPELLGRPIDELLSEAAGQDDPMGYLAIWAPSGETSEGAASGNEKATEEASRPSAGDDTSPELVGEQNTSDLSKANAIESPPASDQSGADKLTKLADRITSAVAKREQDHEYYKGEAFDYYRNALLSESDDLSEQVLDSLVEVCGEAGITPEQIRRDAAMIAKARRMQELWDHHEEYGKATVDKRQARDAIRKEYERRLYEANRALGHAENDLRQAGFACDDLRDMARRRPELFDTSVFPPRLLQVGKT